MALVIASTVLVSDCCLRAADWPQWLGPARNGSTPDTVAPWKDPPVTLWKHSIGAGFGSPVVARGRAFVHTAVPDEEAEQIIAFDALTGEELWRAAYDRAAYSSDLGVGPRATPALADGRIYTVGITGVVSCHDVQSGERLWQTNPYQTLGAPLPGFGACSSPVVADGRVVVLVGGAGNGVVAFDAASGEIAWKSLDEPAGTASPIVRRNPDTGAAEVVVQTTLRLAGLDLQTGKLDWAHPLVFEPSGVAPTPLLWGNHLLCATQDTGALMLELPDSVGGSPQQAWWNQDTKTYFSTGAVNDQGRAFIVTNKLLPLPRADVTCFSADAEEPVWTAEGMGYFHVGLIALADGALLLLDDAGNIVLNRPSHEGLEELARAKVCEGTFASPALSSGRLYVRDNTQVSCVELSADQP